MIMNIDSYATPLRQVLRWPFASPLASPAWLALRLYLGATWLRFGWSKVEAGWLISNPMRPLLEAIGSGGTAAPLPLYRSVAEQMLAVGLDRLLSVAIPLAELAFATAFFAGVLLVPAAIAACLMNLNLILSGIATWSFDGRVILMQLLIILGWRVAGELGLGDSIHRLWPQYREAIRRLRHA